MDAVWAYNVGLVRQVASPDELMKASYAPASILANMPPVALRMLKQMVYESLESAYEEQIRTEAYAGMILSQTQDHKEGIQAFLEKRPPHSRESKFANAVWSALQHVSGHNSPHLKRLTT